MVRSAAFNRAPSRTRILLLRKCNASDVAPANLSEIECQSSPTAADVKNSRAPFDPQLCSQVAFLRELRIIERLIRGLKISATVLLVGVEEELIEPPV